MGSAGAEAASDRCRRYLVLGLTADQVASWRERHGIAPGQVYAVSTHDGAHQVGLKPGPGVEVVLLEGWRGGRYADRLTWQLSSKGFDFGQAADAA